MDNGEIRRAFFQFGCLVAPEIQASVESLGEGLFRYSFQLKNGADAAQDIGHFALSVFDARAVTKGEAPRGWIASHAYHTDWMAMGRARLQPGHEVAGFAVISGYLPGLVRARVEGMVKGDPNGQPLEEDLSSRCDDELARLRREKGAVERFTVGPVNPPPGTDRTAQDAFVGRLVEDVPRGVEGRLVESGTADQLRRILNVVRADLGHPARFQELARQIEALQGIDAAYRAGVALAVRTLGNR